MLWDMDSCEETLSGQRWVQGGGITTVAKGDTDTDMTGIVIRSSIIFDEVLVVLLTDVVSTSKLY